MEVEHCLDFLRQSAMCHGDIGLVTFQWTPDSLIPVSNATVHECVNWDAIDKWTKERTVDMMKPGWLIHPTKGVLIILLRFGWERETNCLGKVLRTQMVRAAVLGL